MNVIDKKIYLNIIYCNLELDFITLLNITTNYLVADIFKSNDEEYINHNFELFNELINLVKNSNETTPVICSNKQNYELYCFIVHSLSSCCNFLEEIIKTKEN